jgi:hypothetical protein
MRGERPKVLPTRLQLHAALPALYSQERARLIDKHVTDVPAVVQPVPERTAVETSAALRRPGPYAGVRNWARYLARN